MSGESMQPKDKNPTQNTNKARFEKAAKDLGCDTSDDALDKAFGGLKVKTDKSPGENKSKTPKNTIKTP